jgi:hypothetical protein
MNSESKQNAHKFGANRKETAHRPRKQGSGSATSRDVREDRGERQSKLGQNERTIPALGPQTARDLKLKSAESREPAVHVRHSPETAPRENGGHLMLSEHASPSSAQQVRLGYYGMEARSVAVAGVFNNWQPDRTPLRHAGDGYWTVDLDLDPGSYEYRFIVDGTWMDDPLASSFVRNPFGSLNSVLHVARPAA